MDNNDLFIIKDLGKAIVDALNRMHTGFKYGDDMRTSQMLCFNDARKILHKVVLEYNLDELNKKQSIDKLYLAVTQLSANLKTIMQDPTVLNQKSFNDAMLNLIVELEGIKS